MEHKLSKAQIEAKTYVENHNLEKVIGDMLNALVYSRDPNPTIFMIKYLSSLTNSNDLAEHGIMIGAQPEASSEVKAIKVTVPTPIESELQESPKPPLEEIKVEEPKQKVFPHFSQASAPGLFKHLTQDKWEMLKDRKTSLNHDLDDCIKLSLQKPDGNSQIYAADAECFEVFKEVFLPIIEDTQGWRISSKHNSDTNTEQYEFRNLDEAGEFVKSISVSLDRNLVGYAFPVALTPDQRLLVIQKVQEILDPYVETSYMKFDDSRIAEADPSLLDNFMGRYESTDLVKDWPEGRGAYLYNGLLISVNMENHLRISSKVNNGDFAAAIDKAFSLARSLSNRFDFSPDLGYLTSSPELIGTGLRIKVVVSITPATQALSFEHFTGVNVKTLGSEIEISNKSTLGVSEKDLIGFVYKATEFVLGEERKSRAPVESYGEVEEGPKEIKVGDGINKVVEEVEKAEKAEEDLLKEENEKNVEIGEGEAPDS